MAIGLRPALRGWKRTSLTCPLLNATSLRPALRGWKRQFPSEQIKQHIRSPTRLEGMGIEGWEGRGREVTGGKHRLSPTRWRR